MLYLTYEDDDVGISILTFLPQVTSSLQHFFVGPERSTLNNLVDPARLGRWQAFGFGGLDVAVRTKIVISRKGYLGPTTDFNSIKRFIFFQVILLLALSKQFGSHPSDLPFCLFAQTFVFVAYNKVVTSQYFLWYLSLLPLVFPARIRLTRSEMATLLLLWGFTQASWLLPAYFLEFKG